MWSKHEDITYGLGLALCLALVFFALQSFV